MRNTLMVPSVSHTRGRSSRASCCCQLLLLLSLRAATALCRRRRRRCSALQAEVDALRVKFDSWRAALTSCNTATDVGFQRAHTSLHADLTKTAEMCRKVKAALANIEARRDKFAHIDDRELDRRKEAVNALEKVRARARAQRGRAGGVAGGDLSALLSLPLCR